MNTVKKWIVAEYLEGIRISASIYDTREDALRRCESSSRIGIECELHTGLFTVEPDQQRPIAGSLKLVDTIKAYAMSHGGTHVDTAETQE